MRNTKKTVLKSIEEQGKLTPNLKTKILETKKDDRTGRFIPSLQKKRKKTNADKAVEAGLEPASIKVLVGSLKDLEELQEFITKDYDTIEKVCEGISHIIGQTFAHDKDNRESLRKYYEKNGYVQSEKKKKNL